MQKEKEPRGWRSLSRRRWRMIEASVHPIESAGIASKSVPMLCVPPYRQDLRLFKAGIFSTRLTSDIDFLIMNATGCFTLPFIEGVEKLCISNLSKNNNELVYLLSSKCQQYRKGKCSGKVPHNCTDVQYLSYCTLLLSATGVRWYNWCGPDFQPTPIRHRLQKTLRQTVEICQSIYLFNQFSHFSWLQVVALLYIIQVFLFFRSFNKLL